MVRVGDAEDVRRVDREADQRLEGTDVRCFAMPGNDDPQALEDCIRRGVRVESCDEAW